MVMDSIREGVKKPWAKILIFVIVISFVGAGYFTSSLFLGDPFAAATVNGESISTREYGQTYSRMSQQYGDAFKQIVRTDAQKRDFEENVLQSLISKTIALQMARDLGMRVSKEQIRKNIQGMAVLQSEGVYSSDQLDLVLRNAGLSRAQFKDSVESGLILSQLSAGIAESDFVLSRELEKEYKVIGQRRSGRALQIKYSLFDAGIEITDEEIESYYQENIQQFKIEEKVSVDYIELSIDILQKAVTVTEEQIQQFYDENLDRFQSEEQRQVSHILIALNDDEDEALKKAEAVKARLDAGEDFVALVKSESNDDYSVENDGDLGIITEGDMEESFEAAMKSLENIGDISEPVKTAFGYHIIKLTGLTPGETKSLDEVKQEITVALKKQTAEEDFYAKSSVLEEKSFEITDSLAEVSKLVDVEVKSSPLFSRRFAPGVLANADVLDEIFSDNVLEANMNSNLINIADDHVIVLRLNKHQASSTQPLEEVKEKVIASLKVSKSKMAAVEYGDKIKSELVNNTDLSTLLEAKGLIWKDLDRVERRSAALPYLQLQKFFAMNKKPSEKSTIDTMEDNNEYVILVLNLIEDGNISEAEENVATQVKQGLKRFYSEADYASLIEERRNEAEVTRNLENMKR